MAYTHIFARANSQGQIFGTLAYKKGTGSEQQPATGSVVITGTATSGSLLTADTSGITDPNGIASFAYQWKSNGSSIPGATNSSYLLQAGDVGTTVTVTVVVTDTKGSTTSLTSAGVAIS